MEAYFGYRGGPLGVGDAASPEVLERFEGIFPASILQIWRTVGFDGIANGRHWITNPLEWAPAVESWLEGLELPFPDQRWWCITRTPHGQHATMGRDLRTRAASLFITRFNLTGRFYSTKHAGSGNAGTNGL